MTKDKKTITGSHSWLDGTKGRFRDNLKPIPMIKRTIPASPWDEEKIDTEIEIPGFDTGSDLDE